MQVEFTAALPEKRHCLRHMSAFVTDMVFCRSGGKTLRGFLPGNWFVYNLVSRM
jgi:hypothetical protein